jgi:hypothetical protein
MSLDLMFYYHPDRVHWEEKFSFLPRRCSESQKIVWFDTMYKGTIMISGPGSAVYITCWLSKERYVLDKLKGIL